MTVYINEKEFADIVDVSIIGKSLVMIDEAGWTIMETLTHETLLTIVK